MSSYTDPSTVKPGRAGTATVRGTRGVRVMRHLTPNGVQRWVSAADVAGWIMHLDADITDLVLDSPAGEAPVDSITITREELAEAVSSDPNVLRRYAKTTRDRGALAGAYLTDLVADKLDALPKPKPEEPKGVGAVALDSSGGQYVRYQRGENAPWHAVGDDTNRPYRYYADLDVVEVLSEGVS